MAVNKAILIGHLGRDPELKYTSSGKAVASFSLATTEKWTSQDGQRQEQTVWHNIVAWGKQAELVKEYLAKGRQVYIEGRIVNRSYDDKEGNKKYISEIVVQSVKFLGSRSDAGGGSQSNAVPADMPSSPPDTSGGGDDDLPF